MLEALRIHSVLFDILSSMGISEIKSLELLLCAVLIVMCWSYLYVFYGYKICLVVVPAVILFFVNWMCKAAVRVELDATAMDELKKVSHFLIGCAIIEVPTMLVVRYLNFKYIKPLVEKIVDAMEQFYIEHNGL